MNLSDIIDKLQNRAWNWLGVNTFHDEVRFLDDVRFLGGLSFEGVDQVRVQLTADTTYYVREDGDDDNDGLADSATRSFATIQRAFDVLGTKDTAGYDVTIQVADGTYTDLVVVQNLYASGGSTITLLGNPATPSSCLISVTGNHALKFSNTSLTINGFKLSTTTSGSCIVADLNAFVLVGEIEFGAAAGYHVQSDTGALIYFLSNYTISGSSYGHMHGSLGGNIQCPSLTITLTGTPAWGSQFARAVFASTIYISGCTFSGSATGTRYDVGLNGIIYTGGGGANYLPGDAAGSAWSGGQYL